MDRVKARPLTIAVGSPNQRESLRSPIAPIRSWCPTPLQYSALYEILLDTRLHETACSDRLTASNQGVQPGITPEANPDQHRGETDDLRTL